ncbi:hypothetical protein D0Z07_1173 [Hyphodiscus hymeniophilus]|uniref:N-acetyltransferase domain-containing protein n=1 Tax=Hyphodiscus hymeniophilus TaxID=353542 RepID=A0A9P6VR21_9HELO|nr:hypothetical protein D0Z07_1173 [Hyphodiscus hymeniophilus]
MESKITLAPVPPSDYLTVAHLMNVAFGHEEFGIVAFGPERNSEAAIQSQAKSLDKAPHAGETNRYVKAITTLPDGKEEIVGFANWTICVGRTGSEEEKVRLGTREGWAQEEREKGEKEHRVAEGKETEEDKPMFGPGGTHGNRKLWADAFIVGDEHQARSTGGKDYLKLSTLVVSPDYQRRGIGALLIEDGLKVADEAGLQAVLGASDQGIGLYKKHGFGEDVVVDLKLWEYEGGEGLGVTRHVYMHRPAVVKG